jgi:hypothetical protein
MFVLTIQVLYTQSVVHGLSRVCTDHTVVVHAGVVYGLSRVCTDHTVVVHKVLYGQYKQAIVHEPHLCE